MMLDLVHGMVGILVLLYHHTHYTLHGAVSSVGAYCGVFSVRVSSAVSDTSWAFGTALSFKLLMIIYHSNNITYFIEGIFLWIELLLV